jgi:hypothetical protein
MMALAKYDIFKKADNEMIWVEAATDLASAKKRIAELTKRNRCQYVVFGHAARQILASSAAPPAPVKPNPKLR